MTSNQISILKKALDLYASTISESEKEDFASLIEQINEIIGIDINYY